MLDSPEGQLQDYLERLCNLMRSQGRGPAAAFGLQPAQMEALRYLARCNRYSNTPLAVAEYLGTTKGTVSQTLKVLEAKGLVTKVGNPRDRRIVHLVPTDQGLEILHQTLRDPVPQGSLQASGGPDLSTLVTGLRRLRELPIQPPDPGRDPLWLDRGIPRGVRAGADLPGARRARLIASDALRGARRLVRIGPQHRTV